VAGKIPSIPEPGSDFQSIIKSVRALKDAVTQLSRNEQGVSTSQIFQLASSATGQASVAVSAQGAQTTLGAQFVTTAVSNVLVVFGYYGSAASAADTLQLLLDGTLVASVPLALVSGNAMPQQGAKALTNVGVGVHNLTVKTVNGLSGLYVAAMAFGV
jgi:hypothetical protein